MNDEKPVNPNIDPEFKRKSLDFGSIEDRRRFEQNLIKYGLLETEAEETPTLAQDIVTSLVTIINNVYGEAIWEKIGHDAWYRKGDVRVKNNLGVGIDPEVPVHIAGVTRVETAEDASGEAFFDIVVGEV